MTRVPTIIAPGSAPRTLPAEVSAALERGRTAYLTQDYKRAEAADEHALRLAEQLGSAEGIVRATRLLGLCAYRLGDSTVSAARLETARDRAADIGWESEELLVCNHLGATYRKLGRLDDADAIFREALRRADPRQHLVARARLTGNYGAFLDDLGERAAAGEYYARYEELLGLLDEPTRLATAHGLVSRMARLRGDLDLAESKARAERDLGRDAGASRQEGRGLVHLAQAHAAMRRFDEAFTEFAAAWDLSRSGDDARGPVEVATAWGHALLEAGRLHEAHEQCVEARTTLEALGPTEHEHRSRVSLLAAEVATAAGLHGESLWHMGNALEAQLRRFEPIRDPRLRTLTAGRRRALIDLARRVLAEASVVDRTATEEERVRSLIDRLGEDLPAPESPRTESVDSWRRRIRREAEERWRRLLPEAFDKLSTHTRGDLLFVDVLAQGPVGDLPRSLFLLFVTMEREVGERRYADTPEDKRPALGTLVGELRGRARGTHVDPALGGLRRLAQPVERVDGRKLANPLKTRNDIAHGRAQGGERIDADAVRRVLTLGRDAPLQTVLGLHHR